MSRITFILIAVILPWCSSAHGDETLKQFAETLQAEAFPKGTSANVSSLKAAGNRPSWMLSVPDGGARAARVAARKKQDPLAGFLDAVSSNNWENRLYVTECLSNDDAKLFAGEMDGRVALESITLGAVQRGTFVVWGDFRLVEKVKDHWGLPPDKARRDVIEKLSRLREIGDTIQQKVFPDATIEVWQRWRSPDDDKVDTRPLVHVESRSRSQRSNQLFVAQCQDESDAASLLSESKKKGFAAFVVGNYVAWGDKEIVEQLRRKKSVVW